MAFLSYKYQDPSTLNPAPAPKPAPLTPELQNLYDTYMKSGGSSGIPTALYQAAQSNPSLGIDRSGNALTPADSMFNFYNPTPNQTPGTNWFPTDDRNLPPALTAAATGQPP